ncbi:MULTISPECIES: class I SAM-dependent methyltransferase [Acidithrix]|uniref:Class I SAM-dependent methyltransferase n=1 Tax=Acidithrix ferrooxidans TaxID=1280514 RepID=A0A0D8HGZ5_9ACTN|nr:MULTISPECIES: class I SAM-dependent methyltransferase [Acidithrix]KJF17047.1 hypothetical protein AXFE_21180 [Acidithrix ferrooxidans]CAG4919064.1 unnamed protein product [Acidithrix sp. C25]
MKYRLSLPAELLDLALWVKGFMPTSEGEALCYWASKALASPNSLGIEIGTYCGLSTIYLGYAASLSKSLVVTIDHHKGSIENGPDWESHDWTLVDPVSNDLDTLGRFRAAMRVTNLNKYVMAVLGDSRNAAKFIKHPVDFIFLDGGHDEKTQWSDFQSYSPLLGLGGTLAIHDVFPDPKDGGRPPFEIFQHALESATYQEISSEGSLRILKKIIDDGA